MMNGIGHDEDAAVLDELRQWRQRGVDLRGRLQATRDRLAAQLKEVDAALAELTLAAEPPATEKGQARPESQPRPNGQQWVEGLRQQDLTAPDLVLAVLARAKRWMTATEIFGIARQINVDLDATLLHSAIYRLKQSNRILARGTKGSKVYAPLGLEEEQVAEK